jgi:hypothetical protein
MGPDLTMRNWLYEGTEESPQQIPALPDAHDKGVAEHPEQFEDTFKQGGPNAIYMGLNEYVGYMHAGRQMESAPGGKVTFNYDPHYCQHFKSNESTWQMDVADWARKEIEGKSIVIDGNSAGRVAAAGAQSVTIPAGLGTHTLEIR